MLMIGTVKELRRLVLEIGEHRRQALSEVSRWVRKEMRREKPLGAPFRPEGLFARHGVTQAFVRPNAWRGERLCHAPPAEADAPR
jgi:hypothetical protein